MAIGKVSSLLGHFRQGYMDSEGLDANFHHTSLDGPKFNFHVGGVYKISQESQDSVSERLKRLPEIEEGYHVFVSDQYEVMCHISKKSGFLCFDTFRTIDVDEDLPEKAHLYGEETGKAIANLVEYFTSEK